MFLSEQRLSAVEEKDKTVNHCQNTGYSSPELVYPYTVSLCQCIGQLVAELTANG